MRRLILDLSTSTGYAVFEEDKLVKYGTLTLPRRAREYGKYPWSLFDAAQDLARQAEILAIEWAPNEVVVEETNLGKANRYSQKLLEWIHFAVLQNLPKGRFGDVLYISSAAWRKTLGIGVNADQRKQNQKLSRLKSECRDASGKLDLKKLNEKKKAAGIGGKVTKKHAAIAYVNQRLGMALRPKDDDVADAICLGLARIEGAPLCDGT